MASNSPQFYWIKVGNQMIWESRIEKLLGNIIEKDLKFERHVENLCKKTNGKVTALARLVNCCDVNLLATKTLHCILNRRQYSARILLLAR